MPKETHQGGGGNYPPPGYLASIEQAESGGDTNKSDSPTGAQGAFQFEPGTAAEYGVKDPKDVRQSAAGASKFLMAMGSEFHHDWGKVAAGYNAGPGAVEHAVKKYGDKWLDHMPSETRHYVRKVMEGLG
jgi:soluble lytic murein transglycosylase-like protein